MTDFRREAERLLLEATEWQIKVALAELDALFEQQTQWRLRIEQVQKARLAVAVKLYNETLAVQLMINAIRENLAQIEDQEGIGAEITMIEKDFAAIVKILEEVIQRYYNVRPDWNYPKAWLKHRETPGGEDGGHGAKAEESL